VPSVAGLPGEAALEKEFWSKYGICSALIIPLHLRNRLVGLYGFALTKSSPVWGANDQALIKLVGEILTSAWARKQSEEELQQLSATLELRIVERTRQLKAEIVERKRTEEMLRESMEKLERSITDRNRDLGILYDIQQPQMSL